MSFSVLGLDAKILRAVTEAGYTEPTPIQAAAIPRYRGRAESRTTGRLLLLADDLFLGRGFFGGGFFRFGFGSHVF